GVPFAGPIAAARVGYKDGQYLLNPTRPEAEGSQLELIVAGTAGGVLMVESQANGLAEDVMLGAVVFGHEQMQVAINAINQLVAEAGKARWDWKPAAEDAGLVAFVQQHAEGPLSDAYRITARQERYGRISQIKEALAAAVPQVDGVARWGTQAIAGQVFNL